MFRSAALTLTLCLATMTAPAATIFVTASGYQIGFDDPSGLLPLPPTPNNTTFEISFTYDSGTPDTEPNPGVGEFTGAISDVRLSIGNNTLGQLADNLIKVSNGASSASGGQGDFWVAETSTYTAPLRTSITLLLVNIAGNVFESDALIEPSFPWSIGFIDYSIEDRTDPNQRIVLASAYARLTYIGVSSVPAPAAGWLLATGLTGLCVRQWLRRKVIGV